MGPFAAAYLAYAGSESWARPTGGGALNGSSAECLVQLDRAVALARARGLCAATYAETGPYAALPECAYESTTDFAGAQEPFLFTYAPPRATEMVPLDSANRGSGFLQTSRLA